MGVKRIIVEEEIADEFASRLTHETRKIKMGNPMDKNTDLGPLIDENAAIMVERSVNDAIEKGAELLCGGKRKNNFFEATVLVNRNIRF